MLHRLLKKGLFVAGSLGLAAADPMLCRAQLVQEAAPPQQASAKQNSSGAQTPSGKKRISQEVQLTGEESWIDTGIDVQPGEHVVIRATGKLRYTDANDDNGPEGLGRGFRDL